MSEGIGQNYQVDCNVLQARNIVCLHINSASNNGSIL